MSSPICTECGARHDEKMKCLDVIITGISALLMRVGQLGTCNGCGASIFFLRHVNGKMAPYDRNGQTHFSTCPKAGEFRRG